MANLKEAIEYHGEQLFDGAIDLDWYLSNSEKTNNVARKYIFHGPQYHTGNIADSKTNASNKLIDSITMTSELLQSVSGTKNQMILDIAGYGAGKSHFALMVSVLLSSTDKNIKEEILNNISHIDHEFRKQIEFELLKDERPVLVIPINGMRNCNLQEEFFRTARKILIKDNQSLDCLQTFDPRFASLTSIVKNHYDQGLMTNTLLKAGIKGVEEFYRAMSSFSVEVYNSVVRELNVVGETVYAPAAHGELKDLIPSIASANCGEGKHYRSMLIVFDEFGKYMMFAASNESIAGSGIMQQLFEGIQSTATKIGKNQKWLASLLGLSQLDLKEYQVSSDSDINTINNKSRYVTRFDGAKRFYLSVSFESLIANLIEKKNPSILPDLNNSEVYKNTKLKQDLILHRFPSAKQLPVWVNETQFIKNVCLGCWPLSPYSVWMLTYITSVNNILQQRSSLNLLGAIFEKYKSLEIVLDDSFYIHPTDFYDVGLGQEFLSSEQHSNDPFSSATKCHSILEKYSNQMKKEEQEILKTIVLSQKMQAYCNSKKNSIDLLSELAGIPKTTVQKALARLENEFNSIEFDDRNNLFLLRSDAPSARDFQKKLDGLATKIKMNDTLYSQYARVNNFIDSSEFEMQKSLLFPDIECDFSMKHDIHSLEWSYKAEITSVIDFNEYLKSFFSYKKMGIITHFAEPKGRVLYLIVPGSLDIGDVSIQIKKLIENLNISAQYIVPLMCLLLSDVSSIIADSILQLNAIKQFNHEETEMFGSLIKKQKKDLIQSISNEIEKRKLERIIITTLEVEGLKLKELGELLFESAYPKVIPFKVDGFGKSTGNGPNTAKKFIAVLGDRNPSWRVFVNKCTSVDVNRAKQLLQNCWEAVNRDDGSFRKIPKSVEVSNLFNLYDRIFEEKKVLHMWDLYEIAQKPPYGANSTAASLLVMLYYASRHLLFEVRNEEDSIKMQSLVAKHEKDLIDSRSKGLQEKVFKSIAFYPVVYDDSRWITLLNEWENAKALTTLIECKDQADILIIDRIRRPDSHEEVFSFQLERSVKAKTKQDEWNQTGKRIYRNLLELFEQRNGYTTIVYEFQKFTEVYKKTFGSYPDDLLDFEKKMYERTIEEVSTYIRGELPSWIERHALPKEFEKDIFQNLEKKYNNLQKILGFLGFFEEQKLLSEILQNGNKRQQSWLEYYKQHLRTKKMLDSLVQNFEKFGTVPLIQSKKLIAECTEERNKLWAFDSEILSIIDSDFDDLLKRISEISSKFQTVIDEKNSSLEALFSRKITSIEDLNLVQNDISVLYNFYQGDMNLETIKDMQNEVQLLREAFNLLHDNNLTWTELDVALQNQKELIEKELKGDSCFDDDAILDSFYTAASSKRNQQSEDWLLMRYEERKKVKDLASAQKLIYNIDAHPVYINYQNWAKALELRREAFEYVSAQKVEYIYSMFMVLSNPDKKVLFEKIRITENEWK